MNTSKDIKELESKIEETIISIFVEKTKLLGTKNLNHRRFYPLDFVNMGLGSEENIMLALRNLMNKGRLNISVNISNSTMTFFSGDIRDLSLQQLNDYRISITPTSNLSFNCWCDLTDTFVELLEFSMKNSVQ